MKKSLKVELCHRFYIRIDFYTPVCQGSLSSQGIAIDKRYSARIYSHQDKRLNNHWWYQLQYPQLRTPLQLNLHFNFNIEERCLMKSQVQVQIQWKTSRIIFRGKQIIEKLYRYSTCTTPTLIITKPHCAKKKISHSLTL
jgi:hypothetical protein